MLGQVFAVTMQYADVGSEQLIVATNPENIKNSRRMTHEELFDIGCMGHPI